ncbi:UDP-N-acetylmuramoyl-L-alanyl-D-glutamate--2,6-diaminopimelate ligase [Methyloterricola oryzae]|uniref:UDP-N-acetylmuramoyl-L-alanyl-D-glutamate--2, 6-diaminopimelate ligase n=1 Tax=Methyloterricola oryzae TaxID=1495050 RepID=UPI0005EB5886|nr:UDP-N-acetylmuramoyl-L-alanyl-D-glutamate--2,6-diaminopimelate ligase [Methyloterricola oryzae]
MMPAKDTPPDLRLDRLLEGLVEGGPGVPSLVVRGLSLDSRDICPGDVFFALAGTRCHGLRYAEAAIAAGACAILYEPAEGGTELARGISAVPCVPVAGLQQRVGQIADRFYGEPSRHLDIIGITGTNGKTSCSHFLAHALNNHRPAAVIGTLGWGVLGELSSTSHTTPDAIEVHALLDRLRGQNVRAVAMEASSHGLVQGRVNGVRFRGGLFTNLSRDHLDYHGNMEAYLDAKLRLVRWPELNFIAFNLDDPSAEGVLRAAPAGLRRLAYTLNAARGRTVDAELVCASAVAQRGDGVSFRVSHSFLEAEVSAPLYGRFNVENLLGVTAVLLGMGYSLGEAARRVSRVKAVPGRMERFSARSGYEVIVDYAHTPDALEKVLDNLRQHCKGRLTAVFGCGGDRDKGKRPQMGAIAERLADRVIVTDDNPRTEDGQRIVEEILAGCQAPSQLRVQRDRRAAIAEALADARPGDMVLVAGKGHEDTQDIGGIKHPFSDRVVVCELLQAMGQGVSDATD